MIDPDLQARASGEKGLTVWPLFGAWRPQAIFETAHTERAVSEVEQVTLETMPSPCRRSALAAFDRAVHLPVDEGTLAERDSVRTKRSGE